MSATTIQTDFVQLLQAQLAALQAGDRDALDLPLLADELEPVVGCYRNEVREHAKIIIGILMRTDWVYGDWTELKLHRDLLLGAMDDSPSLMGSADMQVAAAYEHVRGIAVLHGLHYWAETTPWPTLQMLLDTAAEADCRYLAHEKAQDPRFARFEPIPKNEEESQLLV